MGKVTISIPLVTWRDGRPRFIPGVAARKLGFAGEDLRHGRNGPWFTLPEAIAWSERRQAEIQQSRSEAATRPARSRRPTTHDRRPTLLTIGQLCSNFLSSPRMEGKAIVEGRKRRAPLSANTIRAYRGSARLLENFEGGFAWGEPADDLTPKALAGLLDRVEVAHGLAQARALRAFLSVAYGHARARGSVVLNPVAAMETTLPVLEARVRPASVAEIATFVAACDALGFPDVADLILAGVWTGQRQNDRLALTEAAIGAEGILFAPSKKQRTSERLLIPVSKQLAARLEAARARRREWKIRPLPGGPLFLCEANRRPWQADWYRKVFRVLRHAAAHGAAEPDGEGGISREAKILFGSRDVAAELAAAQLTPLASLADLRDQDLRDTSLSWLALAGVDRFGIAAFSGHAFGQSDKVLRHYVAIPPEFARAAMVKLEAWHELRASSGQRYNQAERQP